MSTTHRTRPAKTPRISKAARDLATNIDRIGAHLDPVRRAKALDAEIMHLQAERRNPRTAVTVALCDLRIEACRKALGY